jgi:broad specificity phosphatase PhoE
MRGSLRLFDHAYSAPERRARQTAEAFGLDAEISPMLRDCNFGCWAGKTLRNVEREDPLGLAAWIADPSVAPHGGESILDVMRRTVDWLDKHCPQRGRVAVISHSTVIRCAILSAIGGSSRSFWNLNVSPLATVDMSCDGRRWVFQARS